MTTFVYEEKYVPFHGPDGLFAAAERNATRVKRMLEERADLHRRGKEARADKPKRSG